jgi:phthiocerol/phenolphthiocerol synthesis type-I polyketide synthase E
MSPSPARLFVYLRWGRDAAGIIRADLDLFGPDDRLLAEASGYALRKVEAQRLRTTPDVTSQPAADGIATTDRVALTLPLLTARHPGQVLVEPGARPLSAARQQPRADEAGTPSGDIGETRSAQPSLPSGAHEVEEKARALWIDATGDPEVTSDADFFAVGGNSLTAVTLIGGLREALGVSLPISAIFDNPTIGSLAGSSTEQIGQHR